MTFILRVFRLWRRWCRSLTVMLTKIPKEKLWVNPDCGLKTRGVPEADASLRNMVKAAEEIRKKFS
ncbi:MAG: hypothetical protein ACLUI5_03460 [Fusicatenibacter saccharivorans]